MTLGKELSARTTDAINFWRDVMQREGKVVNGGRSRFDRAAVAYFLRTGEWKIVEAKKIGMWLPQGPHNRPQYLYDAIETTYRINNA